MKKVHLTPLLFSAVVAAFFWGLISRYSIMHFCSNFDIFSPQHWQHIIAKWQKGWVLHTSKEVGFVISLFLLIPGYFLFWFIVYRFPLRKILLSPLSFIQNRKKAKLREESLAAAIGPSDRIKAPAAKKNAKKSPNKPLSKKMQLINTLRGKIDPAHPAESAKTMKQTAQNESLNEVSTWESTAKDLENAGVFIVRQIKITDCLFNLIVFSKDALFLFGEGPSGGSQWETHDDEGIWKTEKGNVPSPLAPMIAVKETLQSYLNEHFPDYSNVSLNFGIILDHGSITNPETFLAYLERNGLTALRMGTCKTEMLPESAVLVEYIKTLPTSSQEMNDAISLAILNLMNGTENGK